MPLGARGLPAVALVLLGAAALTAGLGVQGVRRAEEPKRPPPPPRAATAFVAQTTAHAGAGAAGCGGADAGIGLDEFGGLLTVPAPGGANGHFRTGKFGDRWMLVTPAGHAFWMRGVWAVTGSTAVDELGDSYDKRFLRKYGSAAVGWAQANRRLKSWGFDTIGPYSYRMVLPTNRGEPEWPRGEQPVKMPFLAWAPNPAITGRSTGAYKNLYAGLDASVSVFEYSRAVSNFPDVYDPAWQKWVRDAYASDKDLALYKASPYFIGHFSDDTDYVSGFGSGVDFATDPVGKYHWHLAYLALVTAPRQATNPYSTPPGQAYADPAVHTKLALRDFLRAKYGTVAALNRAWGTSYTSFESDGGWPRGRGLLDESGVRAWFAREQDPFFLKGTPAAARSDLDAFLFEMAKTFFEANRKAFKAVAPDALFLGPTNLGGAGWRSPPRGPILKAAGQFLDVLSVSSDGSQEQLDFIARWAGDVPLVLWEGVVANVDSGRFRSHAEAASWNVPTQEERGRLYQRDVEALVNGRAGPTGSYPYVGLLFWSWTDHFGEAQNWGLVSLLDNAYDGREATRAHGEERDYGDFLGPVAATNLCVTPYLAAEKKAGPGTKPLVPAPPRPPE
jgi:hypothetical protein